MEVFYRKKPDSPSRPSSDHYISAHAIGRFAFDYDQYAPVGGFRFSILDDLESLAFDRLYYRFDLRVRTQV